MPIVGTVLVTGATGFIGSQLCRALAAEGRHVLAPAVPPDECLLRTSYMSTHTDEQIDRAIGILGEVGRELGLIN